MAQQRQWFDLILSHAYRNGVSRCLSQPLKYVLCSTCRCILLYCFLCGTQMDWSQQQRVETDAPSHLLLPTGSTVAIDYSGPQPKARVKLQEVFGLADTPLLGGRGVDVPLLLELLSPAGRPLQVRQGVLAPAAGTLAVIVPRKHLG
jgi:HrpA-like RNA helicase